MAARRLAYRMMAGGPVLFLLGVAILGRIGTPPDPNDDYGTVGNAWIRAYIKPVRHAMELGAKPNPTVAEFDQVADAWIADYQDGKLHDILNPQFQASSNVGVAADIKSAKRKIMEAGVHLARKERKAGRSYQAARNLAKAIAVAQIGKYCDFSAVHFFGSFQGRMVDELISIAPELTAEEREGVVTVLRKGFSRRPSLETIICHIRRTHYRRLIEFGGDVYDPSLAKSYQILVTAGRNPGVKQIEATRQVAHVAGASAGDLVPISSNLRMAGYAEQALYDRLSTLEASFGYSDKKSEPSSRLSMLSGGSHLTASGSRKSIVQPTFFVASGTSTNTTVR
ncbi:MAG: hypothetical protein KIT11_02115 [Fimbriimonadaceae bacterium]|nr:hypothetical protein [Fimbriimonadaceae bacterium]QYK54834.1 MAG: hypothetical protein KF733_07420 [Fimbriimonadaceae bacterium]